MKQATGPRRLLAAAAGVLIGVTGAFASAVPAQAQTPEIPPGLDTFEPEIPEIPDLPEIPLPDEGYLSEALFLDVCDGTYVLLFTGPEHAEPGWEITVDGDLVWPAEGDEQPGPGDTGLVLVPAGEVEVSYADARGEGWPRDHSWEAPALCEELPAPTSTQPTCDDAGTVDIPELPDFSHLDVPPEVPPALVVFVLLLEQLGEDEPVTYSARSAEQPELPLELVYRLDGEDVEPGSSHELEAGDHVVSMHLVITPSYGERSPVSQQIELLVASWPVELAEPECGGSGGELPNTGSSTLLIAGAAVALLALGGGLFLVARRRRTTFSA